ncbi:hypothetical protein O6C96_10125 [Legionella pneumophila]|uniref:hypothetical protein n=1 Tax=Legionella pneumophila TaxID=446 RepID=UPI0022B42BDC|nr:hypothetical protein [Legionella pneumophila]MCZ4762566.1 hypothetical protein [Legionella pneumophila]
MSNFFEELKQLPGKERLNVYALLIAKLSYYNAETIQDKQFIKALMTDIKTLFHNHEQSFTTLAFILNFHLKQHPKISETLKLFINHVIKTTKNSDFLDYFKKTALSKDDLECRIPRFFESNVAINLLQNPSPSTWDSINKVSTNIIKFIDTHYDEKIFEVFLENLGPDPKNSHNPNLPLAFGRYPQKPDIKVIIETLKEQKNFARTMLIHFMFMRDVYCYFEPDIESQNRIKKFGYDGNFKQFILKNKEVDIGPFFWNYPRFSLYKDRGRGEFKFYISQKLGICITPEDTEEFPLFETTWCPDCICQEADLSSEYTQTLIHRNIPYVAGPSGMTSLLSASMVFMGQFESIEEHHHYILAIMSFITGGGLHSIHEVLSVPKERLGLLASYRASGPHAGNYNDFFNLFRYDKTILQNINDAWDATINWIYKKYPDLILIKTSLISEEQPETIIEKLKHICCISWLSK